MRKIFVFVCILTSLSCAAEFKSNSHIHFAADDTVKSDLFTAGESVDIYGTVDGDLYTGAQKLRLNGTVHDDILTWCEEVHINGKVGDMLIAMGRLVRIKGEIGDDALAYGGEVIIEPGTVIHGNLYVGTGQLYINGGEIKGKVFGGAGKAFLNGQVDGKVELNVGKIEFGESYYSKGKTIITVSEDYNTESIENAPADIEFIFEEEEHFYASPVFYIFFLSLLITGILFISVFKNFTRELLQCAQKDILKNSGIGFLALIVSPIVAVILMVLVVTIPLSLILITIYSILLYFSLIFSGLFAGSYVLQWIRKESDKINLYLALLIGIVLIVLLTKIPYLGFLLFLLIFSFGFGIFLTCCWSQRKQA